MSNLAKRLADIEKVSNENTKNEVEQIIKALNDAANIADKLRTNNESDKNTLDSFEQIHSKIMDVMNDCADCIGADISDYM